MTKTSLSLDGLIVLVALGLRLGSGTTADASYFLLAILALRGRESAILALLMSWLFTMLSPGLAPEISSLGSVGRYAVLSGAGVTALVCGKSTFSGSAVWLTAMLGLFVVGHSIAFSPLVDVSLLKAFSWTIAVMTTFKLWGGLSHIRREVMERRVFFVLVAVALTSIPLLFSSTGYLVNGTGLQGILNHPQTMGPTMALLGGWAASQMLGTERPGWYAVALTAACVFLVLRSEARTAGLALAVGFGAAAFSVSVLGKGGLRAALPGLFSSRIVFLCIAGIIILAVLGPRLLDTVGSYILKRGNSSNLIEVYQGSRGDLIDAMQSNIIQSPWRGIGFGIASVPEAMLVTRDPVLGLPIGAAIEKGVMPLAVLEELGVPGFIFVAIWIGFVLKRSARGGAAALSVALTALLLNLGENTLFSAGGFGMLPIVLLGWAISVGPPPSPMRHSPGRRMLRTA